MSCELRGVGSGDHERLNIVIYCIHYVEKVARKLKGARTWLRAV